MKDLNSLLGRITKSLGRTTLLKEALVSIINEKTGAHITTEDASYKDGVLEVKASAALKSELRMKEESIKSAVKQQTGNVVTRVLYK